MSANEQAERKAWRERSSALSANILVDDMLQHHREQVQAEMLGSVSVDADEIEVNARTALASKKQVLALRQTILEVME